MQSSKGCFPKQLTENIVLHGQTGVGGRTFGDGCQHTHQIKLRGFMDGQ